MWEDVWRSPQEARLGGGLLQAGGTHPAPRGAPESAAAPLESSGVCTRQQRSFSPGPGRSGSPSLTCTATDSGHHASSHLQTRSKQGGKYRLG